MPGTREALLLDLHIPYCIQPENYLNYYHIVGSNEEKDRYLASLEQEILSYEGDLDQYEIRAVRLSGGSASVMKPDLLGDVLSLVRRTLLVARGAEFSYDAIPNTIGTPSLTGIATGHPNRVELMMRSENDQELRTLNCPFTMQHTRNAMLFFQKFHMNNIGLTVNYGIPGQTLQSWHNTLRACTIMLPGHITAAPLDVTAADSSATDAASNDMAAESGTATAASNGTAAIPGTAASSGTIATPSDTAALFPDSQTCFEMYNYCCDYLKESGYIHYGVGLFCLPNHENLYRVLDMNNTACIGMGVGNISRFEGMLVRNTNNNRLYMKNAGDFEKLTAQVMEMNTDYTQRRYVRGQLGLTHGLSAAAFENHFRTELPDGIRTALDALVQKGWARTQEDAFILTRMGQFHYGEILA